MKDIKNQCDYCNEAVKENDELFSWINEEHPELNIMYLCDKCGEKFENNFWTCTV